MKKEDQNKAKNSSKITGFRDFFIKLVNGDLISLTFFRNNIVSTMVVIILLLLYITFKYECQTHMETIAKLEKELTAKKSESIRERSTYKSRTRESSMKQQIDSMHIALKVQDQPPYILSYK